MDYGRAGTRRGGETGEPKNLSGPGGYQQAGLGPGIDRIHLEYRHVHDELLDAAAGQITIERIFEQFDRTPGDDPASCRPARNGDGVAEFRSQTRTEISCGDSRDRRWNHSCLIGRHSFYLSNHRASNLRSPWHLQRLWPALLPAGRL